MPTLRGRPLTENDLYLLREGTHVRLFEVLGAHVAPDDSGTNFSVWAPRAKSVSLIGDFNLWQPLITPLEPVGGGIWSVFVAGVGAGQRYKFHVEAQDGIAFDKSDPFGFFHEASPSNASVVWPLDGAWSDEKWLSKRAPVNSLDAPISIYEVHLGSWRRSVTEGYRSLTYRQLAEQLVPYVKEMGFTHVEFMPVMEHPFFGSWGYQTTGYFAATSRYGEPEDLMYLIDCFHREGIAVILDWVPSHFPKDEHALGYFDGVHEYEPSDPRRGLHPDWNSYIFDYRRGEVRSFLLSSALFWLEQFHADGLRVDAVASMLYLDYSRKPGEWIPNEYGGRENLDAIGFLRRLNEDLYRSQPGIQTFAEESTAWPRVSKPTYLDGLGFGFKWDMGWMHDTLRYMSQEPINRKYHHGELTFRQVYGYSENFVLPLSHDEVVYGKGSLLAKMPGDDWRKFANLRLLLAYMFAQPGKKLLFMGGEFGQWHEWNHDGSLEWHLLTEKQHAGTRLLVGDLNRLYRTEPALNTREYLPECFAWVEANDGERNVLAFLRKSTDPFESVLAAFNFSPVPRDNYALGVPQKGAWTEILNTDSKQYGGSGRGNFGELESAPVPFHGRLHSLTVELPPLAAVFFKLKSAAL